MNMMKAMERRKYSPPADCHQVRMTQPPRLPQGSEGKTYRTLQLTKHPSSPVSFHDTYIMVYVWSARVEYWKAKSTWSVCSLLSRVPRWSTPPMVPTYFKVIKIKHHDCYHITLGFILFICWSRWRWNGDPHCVSRSIRGDGTTVGFPVQLEMKVVKD